MSSEIEARQPTAQSSAGQKTTLWELAVMATATLILMCAEAFTSSPEILFSRDLWIDELWTKLIGSEPKIWHSLVVLAHSGDPTPPTYHLLARASWWLSALVGGSGETAFRALAFAGVWLALVLTYAVLRRSFAILPSLIAVLVLLASPVTVKYAFFARPYGLLLASTAAFCLLYCSEDFRPTVAVATAVASVLVCTLHYFGLFALGSIVFGDLVSRRESFRDRLRRVLPAAAGPLVLVLLLPVVRELNSGYDQPSYLAPISSSYVLDTIGGLFDVPILVSAILLLSWWISELGRRQAPRTESSPSQR